MMGTGMMGGMGIISMVICIIVLGLLIFGIYAIISKVFYKTESVSDRSLAILRERLARGEIDEEEFDRKKTLIKKS